MMTHRIMVCCLVLLLATMSSCPLSAQVETATLSGRITDPQGSAVPKAQVQIVSIDTNVASATETNGEGIYFFTGIKPGRYRLLVVKDGFHEIVKPEFTLQVQDHLEQNFGLQVGSVSETVTVTAGGININTTDAAVSTIVDRQFAENLPLNGRSFQSLIYLTPGVTLNMGSGPNSGFAQGQFNVNGQRASSNYWMIDGVSANIGMSPWRLPGNGAAGGIGGFTALGGTNNLVSVDALQEFRIETSTYAPEFGRTPGGQISIATRSGTNQFHGAAFDYFRNSVLDAADWFANANGVPKAAEKQNDFGGVLGGPLIKDKTFFFFSYEGLRLRLPHTILSTVPDLASRKNSLPAVQPFLNAYPLPDPGAKDVGPDIAPFNASYSDPSSVNVYGVRIDHTLAKNLNLFGRYNHSSSSVDTRAPFGDTANTIFAVTSTTNTGTVGVTWTKSSQTVNDIRFNYSSSGGKTFAYMDTFGGGTIAPGARLFPSPRTYQDANFYLIALFGANMTIDEGKNAGNVQHQYNVVDSLSVQKGSHSLKFGVDYRRMSPFNDARLYSLFPYFSSMASLEAGSSSLTQTGSLARATFLFHNLGIFAQDTWRLSSRLTLTYGLRWDVDFTPTTENGPSIPAVTGFSLTDLSSLALAHAGTPIYSTRYGNVAPRIGVAYQISQRPDWGLVLRNGFGLFYDLSSSEVANNNILFYPYSVDITTPSAPFPTPAVVAAAPAIVAPSSTQGTLAGFDPRTNLPYSVQWSVALEQELGKGQTVKASYIGSSGNRLLASESVSNPNPNYMTATLVSNAGSSNYNALQVQFQRRLAGGLQAIASYSWAHSIDTGSYGSYANGSFANANVSRGDSDFDIRRTFSAALTYEVPTLGSNTFTRAISRGWSMDNIIQVHSAPPVDIVDGAFSYLTSQNSQIQFRPDVVPGQPLYLYGSEYSGGKVLNPSAFSDPPVDPITMNPLRQGNLGRNALRGFGLTQWDFAVHRDFPIRESLRVQFRAEMFNVLNHPNFAPYNASFDTGDPFFGQSTQMLNQGSSGGGLSGAGGFSAQYQSGGPRSIQLALKLSF